MKLSAPEADSHLARLRLAELLLLRRYIEPGARVLELGGGNGFQAAVLDSWGCHVTSIDIDSSGRWARQYFPVAQYDGVHLPSPDGAFDIVFSSNVLEHVKVLPALLEETVRVLRPDGRAIHILPTPAWRFWTACTHYPYVLKRLSGGHAEDVGLRPDAKGEAIENRGLAENAWRAIVPRPHGEFRSWIDELFQYRKESWGRRFTAAGFFLETSFESGIFYTGNALAPMLSLRVRLALGRVLGSACRVFVLRPWGLAEKTVPVNHERRS